MTKRMSLFTYLAITACILSIPAAGAKTIYVDADAAGANDGSSWSDACNYLQDGLMLALAGDDVRVARGAYRPDEDTLHPDGTGSREATFQLINGVTLKGGYAGLGQPDPNARDIELYETILSGDLDGNDVDVTDPCDLIDEPTRAENSYHVVTAIETENTLILNGFTIIGGHANDYYGDGGGMHSRGGSPTIVDCTFKGNSARREGGGMSGWGIFYDCRFIGNSAGDGGAVHWGGYFTNCTFIGNSAERYGGGMFGAGYLTGCTFRRNSAGWMGGAIGAYDTADSTMLNCIFEENSAPSGGAIGYYETDAALNDCIFIRNSADYGGGVSNSGGHVSTLVGCTFVGNLASESGGAISNDRSKLILTNCSLSGNSAGNYGGGVFYQVDDYWGDLSLKNSSFAANMAEKGNALACDLYYWDTPGPVQLTNCILSDGGVEVWIDEVLAITVSYSDIRGGQASIYDPCNAVVWGEGNIDADPCFADPGYWDANGTPDDANDDFWVDGDYHLRSEAGRWNPSSQTWVIDEVTSPCIDAGDPMMPIGDEPFPNGGIINMGAYGGTAEASKSYFGRPPCETIIAGDINGDCEINFLDFQLMALHWCEEGD